MLEVRNLTVRYGGLTAVDDLSFSVGYGEIFTLIGPNGAGKTTAFNAIGGFVVPTAGELLFQDKKINRKTPAEVAALGIRRTFQNNGIMREMTALENVLVGLELSTSSSFWGSVSGWRASARAERDATRRARAMLDRMGIAEVADRPAGELSFGQQRLVEIARASVAEARLIMLDEPAVGLSPGERLEVGRVLRDLTAGGVSILLVEHVQDLVAAVSDTVLVLNYGKKIVQCRPSEMYENKEVLQVYLGHA